MGGNGSGRHSDRSTAFDLAELADALLARIERACYDPEVLADRDWLQEQRGKLQSYLERIKSRTLRDRVGSE